MTRFYVRETVPQGRRRPTFDAAFKIGETVHATPVGRVVNAGTVWRVDPSPEVDPAVVDTIADGFDKAAKPLSLAERRAALEKLAKANGAAGINWEVNGAGIASPATDGERASLDHLSADNAASLTTIQKMNAAGKRFWSEYQRKLDQNTRRNASRASTSPTSDRSVSAPSTDMRETIAAMNVRNREFWKSR